MKDCGACIVCKTQVWIPDALWEAANASRNITFYCGYGHGMSFAQGETDEQKMRRERDRLLQERARLHDRIREERETREATERQLSAQRGVVTRIKNRVGHGVCPCCSRTFENLARHMKSKHSEYSKSDVVLTAAE